MTQSRPPSAPWCRDDCDILAQKISTLANQLQDHPKLNSFILTAAIMTVVDTLKYEVTWPSKPSEEVLQKVLQAMWINANTEIPDDVTWDAEGENTHVEEARKQVSQSMLSLKFLWHLPSDHTLTADDIKEAHAKLMAGAVSAGELMDAGTYRTIACHSPGGIAFYPPQDIASAVESLVSDLAESTPSAATAAKFCHKFLVIHPFSNGNGRLARFLVAWIMRSAGVPFPISIGQGKNARKHWLQAVRRNDKGLENGLDWLESLILESCLNRWINFSLQVNKQIAICEQGEDSGCSFLHFFLYACALGNNYYFR